MIDRKVKTSELINPLTRLEELEASHKAEHAGVVKIMGLSFTRGHNPTLFYLLCPRVYFCLTKGRPSQAPLGLAPYHLDGVYTINTPLLICIICSSDSFFTTILRAPLVPL